MKSKIAQTIFFGIFHIATYLCASHENSPSLPVTLKAYSTKNKQGNVEIAISWHSKAFSKTLFEENNTIYSRIFLFTQIDAKANPAEIKEFQKLKELTLKKADEKKSIHETRTFVIKDSEVTEVTTED